MNSDSYIFHNISFQKKTKTKQNMDVIQGHWMSVMANLD